MHRRTWPLVGLSLAALIATIGPREARAQETVDEVRVKNRNEGKRIVKNERALATKLSRAAQKALNKDSERRTRLMPPGVDLKATRTVSYAQGGSGPGTAVLDSLETGVQEFGSAMLLSGDRRRMAALYRSFHGRLPAKYLERLPAPDRLDRMSLAKVRKHTTELVKRMVTRFTEIRIDIPPALGGIALLANPIGACDLELGYEVGGAEISDRCVVSDYAADGIMKNVNFPLKDDLTCIKDQKNRGTCVAHAICAAAESQILVNGGVAENLSEQKTYYQAKIYGDWTSRYISGINTAIGIDALISTAMEFPREEAWNYNPSPSRSAVADLITHLYSNSCVGYIDPPNEMCTDFEFQCVETLTFLPGLPILLAATYTLPNSTPSSGHRVTGRVEVGYLPGLAPMAAVQLPMVAVSLATDTPVIARISVPPAFRAPDPDGYVRFVAGQASSGTHAVEVVGYVPNGDLPVGVATDPGIMGGYYVVKNSWGKAYGDCGFCYLSSEFLENWGLNYYTLVVN